MHLGDMHPRDQLSAASGIAPPGHRVGTVHEVVHAPHPPRRRLHVTDGAEVDRGDVLLGAGKPRPKSASKLECSKTPAIANGCNACKNRALTPPTPAAGSACTRQLTLSGPNRPSSSVRVTTPCSPPGEAGATRKTRGGLRRSSAGCCTSEANHCQHSPALHDVLFLAAPWVRRRVSTVARCSIGQTVGVAGHEGSMTVAPTAPELFTRRQR